MKHHMAIGRLGEDLAAEHLVDQGYQILARNWRCPIGELDIVAEHGQTLIAVEVKTRTSTAYGYPIEAVGHTKAVRLRKLLFAFAAEHQCRYPLIRVDVVALLGRQGGGFSAKHYVGVA